MTTKRSVKPKPHRCPTCNRPIANRWAVIGASGRVFNLASTRAIARDLARTMGGPQHPMRVVRA